MSTGPDVPHRHPCTGTSSPCCAHAQINTFIPMFGKGGPAHPRRRRTRRFAFFALLLLVLVAPIGWVAASTPSEPYVVLFNDDAVTVPDSDSFTATSLTALLSNAAATAQPGPVAVGAAKDGVAHRHVDAGRVAAHLRDITARNGIGAVDDVYDAAVGGFSARLTTQQVAAITADPSVGLVVPDEAITDQEIEAAGLSHGPVRQTSHPSIHVQPGIRRIGARTPSVEALIARGLKVDADVAILDTGIDRTHPDLNVAGGYNCTGRNRDAWDDDNGHGTHVAGIVGAMDNNFGVTGVAPGVRLWSVKVLDKNGHGFVSWLVCGVDWVTAQRDKSNPSRPLFEVANMSLAFTLAGANDKSCGTTNHDTLHMAICRSVDKGTTYVVAAGNDTKDVRRTRPAAYDEVITVSAMADYDGRGGGHGYPAESCPYWSPEKDDGFASFSNYGPDVDLIAPGKCILSTYLNGRYAWMSGTSMATPHVTGAALLYKQMYPRATPAQVRMALEAVGTLDWLTKSDPDQFHEKAVWIGAFRSMPDFSLDTAVNSAVTAPGSTVSVGVSLGRVGGFNDPITVSLSNPPQGISATSIVTKGTSAKLTLRVGPNARFGRYTLSVTGQAQDIVHVKLMTIDVRGSAPQSAFTSPTGNLNVQSDTAVRVAWNEQAGGANIVGRRLDRQIATIRTPGTCSGVTWANDQSRSNATNLTDHVASGYCYRWVLTLTDSAGLKSTVYSGAVLVDATAPREPVIRLSGSAAYTPDLAALGVNATHYADGTLWVRVGASGYVPLEITSSDPESGVARNIANVSGNGWQADWVGSSANGSLRLSYGPNASSGHVTVSSINGAGSMGPATTMAVLSDATNPGTPTWVSAPAHSTKHTFGAYFKLDWSSVSDTGSGLATQLVVARYKAPLNPDGTCRTNGFTQDGGFRLMSNDSWDSGMVANACYVWSVRAIDNVGNMSASSVSGYVITDRNR
jgi:subtilisin